MSNDELHLKDYFSVDKDVNMKNLISKNISLHLYKNALFYAEKNLCISTTHDLNSIYENIYLLAKCLYLNKEYSRCVNLIQKYIKIM